MATFLYKTKGNADPKGKPRVYFTCHPDDFERYFAKIWEDISATHDVALYYTEDMKQMLDSEHLETDLGQMNLFVVPVTWKLLREPNRAMDEDVAYAKQENIPILPFMMEQGIDESYAKPEKFGERQYLSPYASDMTAIRYEEKLKKYLESVLISDELAQRVREAFDAYIFLSYRKKDRKYANELMKLIHKNPECRDVAIWYDEFLTPGESFADNIKKALEDSKLFALLVTPNLLEEPEGKPNFVMAKEYPAAIKAEKAILPAEMVQTDHEALENKFPGIPNCADPQDEERFKERLLQSLQRIAISANNNDPEHNFLIGLAYLEGIDVEVNLDRGVELIISAADSGLIEAIDQLVQMYTDGIVVTMSRDKAFEWIEKKTAVLQHEYDKAPDEDKLLSLISSVKEYFRLCVKLGRAADAHKKCEQLEQILDVACEKPVHMKIRRSLAFEYVSVGLSYSSFVISDSYAERRNLEKAYRIVEAWAREVDTEDAWLDVEFILIGHLCRNCESTKDYAAERHYYERALAIQESRCCKAGTENRTSHIYEELSRVCLKCGDSDDAKLYLEKGLNIREMLTKEADSVEAWMDLSYSYGQLEALCRSCGDLNCAQRSMEKALSAAEMPIRKADTIEKRRTLASEFEKMKYKGDVSKQAYEKAVSIREALVQETGATEDMRALLACYGEKKAFFTWNGLEDRAHAEKELAILEMLVQETGDEEDYGKLSEYYLRLSKMCNKSHDYAHAREYLQKKLTLDRLPNREIGDVIRQKIIADDYFNIGELVCDDQNDINAAQKYFDQTIAITEEMAQETNDAEHRVALASCYLSVGRKYKVFGLYDDAKRYYEKALAIQEALEQEKVPVKEIFDVFMRTYNPDQCYTVPSETYTALSFVCRRIGDLASARMYLEKALAVMERTANRTGHVNDRRSLLTEYNILANMCNAQGDYIAQKEYCTREFTVAETLMQDTGSVQDRRSLMLGHVHMGDVSKISGDIDGARWHYDKALAICNAQMEEKETLENWDDLAWVYYKCAMVFEGEKRAHYRRESLRIYEMLCQKDGNTERYLRMLESVKTEIPE